VKYFQIFLNSVGYELLVQ